MKIFLSHTHADKPVVEPIAIRLRDIFGQEGVFYDSWAVQPGDGIIEKMNEGLAAPDFVFFFVSAASLESNMVKLEWQNSLFASTKGKVRIIPVRVDDEAMPPVLLSSLYIDLYTHGIEAAITQIVNVIQGQNTFSPQHGNFSNLSWIAAEVGTDQKRFLLTVKASHYMEPNCQFLVVVENTDTEIAVN